MLRGGGGLLIQASQPLHIGLCVIGDGLSLIRLRTEHDDDVGFGDLLGAVEDHGPVDPEEAGIHGDDERMRSSRRGDQAADGVAGILGLCLHLSRTEVAECATIPRVASNSALVRVSTHCLEGRCGRVTGPEGLRLAPKDQGQQLLEAIGGVLRGVDPVRDRSGLS